jgi:hypothetical protein
MAPEDSIQHYVTPWWVDAREQALRRGRLLKTLVPFPEQATYVLHPEARKDATDHSSASVIIEPYGPTTTSRTKSLPVAALPEWPGTRFIISRGRVRPVLVLTEAGPVPAKSLVSGVAPYQVRPTVLVAPFFGADQDGTRSGLPASFRDRIRHAEYPQYVWDELPLGAVRESYLRLDQVFPMGTDPAAFQFTDYSLSRESLQVIDEWFDWLRSGDPAPPDDSVLGYLRTELMKLEPATATVLLDQPTSGPPPPSPPTRRDHV